MLKMMILAKYIKLVRIQHLTFVFKVDGYLFKEKRLCVSNCSMHELLICEAHMSGLMRHFRVAKTLDVLHEHFFFAQDEKEYVKNL